MEDYNEYHAVGRESIGGPDFRFPSIVQGEIVAGDLPEDDGGRDDRQGSRNGRAELLRLTL